MQNEPSGGVLLTFVTACDVIDHYICMKVAFKYAVYS